ncbi:MAG TPA: hypothetical protein VMC43_03775, partial [Candidatus Paceibacterota bacterium]|nr:hypothetical protein [Candidatus Paceibacterota bacterium]
MNIKTHFWVVILFVGSLALIGRPVFAQAVPLAPPGLTASPTTDYPAKVNLSWGVSTDDAGIEGYNVYRNGVLIGSGNFNSWTDGGI